MCTINYLLEEDIIKKKVLQYFLVTQANGNIWYNKYKFSIFVNFIKDIAPRFILYNSTGIWYYIFTSENNLNIVDNIQPDQCCIQDSVCLINIVANLGIDSLLNMMSKYNITIVELSQVQKRLLHIFTEYMQTVDFKYTEPLYLNMLNIRSILKSHTSDLVCSRLFGLSRKIIYNNDIDNLIVGFVKPHKMLDEYHINSIKSYIDISHVIKYINIMIKNHSAVGNIDICQNLSNLLDLIIKV
jgi:hypothetical protein